MYFIKVISKSIGIRHTKTPPQTSLPPKVKNVNARFENDNNSAWMSKLWTQKFMNVFVWDEIFLLKKLLKLSEVLLTTLKIFWTLEFVIFSAILPHRIASIEEPCNTILLTWLKFIASKKLLNSDCSYSIFCTGSTIKKIMLRSDCL